MKNLHSHATESLLDLYLSLPLTQRNERFADTSQTALRTGVSRRTIQVWIEAGAIHTVRIGHKYKVDLDSLREFLQSQKE